MNSPILIMGPLYGPTMAELESRWPCRRLWEAPDKAALIAQMAPDCQVVVTNGGRGITAAEIDQLPKLELVSCFGVGTDAIAVAHARARGVVVTNTPDVLTEDVADLALALLLAAVRQVAFGDRFVRAGRWLRENPPMTMSGSSIAAGRPPTRRWVRVAVSPQTTQIAVSIVIWSAIASRVGIDPKGRPAKSVFRPLAMTLLV